MLAHDKPTPAARQHPTPTTSAGDAGRPSTVRALLANAFVRLRGGTPRPDALRMSGEWLLTYDRFGGGRFDG